MSVQTHLQLNVTDILENDPRFFNTAFNWTAFNAKVVDIYGYVDSLVRAEEQRINPNTLAKLREDFKQSWTEDLNAREALEIRWILILFDKINRFYFKNFFFYYIIIT